jgi:hypothetical protein
VDPFNDAGRVGDDGGDALGITFSLPNCKLYHPSLPAYMLPYISTLGTLQLISGTIAFLSWHIYFTL